MFSRLGLDPKVLAGIVNTSSGRCWSSEVYNPVPGVMPGVPSANDYQVSYYPVSLISFPNLLHV